MDALCCLAERVGLFVFRVASAKDSSLVTLVTARGASCASDARWSNPSGFVHTPTSQIQNGTRIGALLYLAERVGFEPTVTHNATPDFESGTFDHSDTSP